MTIAGQLGDAGLDALIAGVRGRPVAMLSLARSLLIPRGKIRRARALCEEALALAPDDPEVLAHAHFIKNHGVADWYFSMVQDHQRHALYARAFRDTFKPGCTVLDIGAGTGLFAMIAVREGAARVIACERDPVIAEAARDIVAANHLSDRITILTKDSRDLEIGRDLDERADVLLWDNLANNLLGAGAAETVEDAKRRLIKPEAPIIPARAEIRVGLAEDVTPQDRSMGIAAGFDMTAFNRLAPSDKTVETPRIVRRSALATIFDVDFRAATPVQAEKRDVVMASTGGRIDCIVQSLLFHLTDEVVYDTGVEGVAAFGLQLHAVAPFVTDVGQPVTVSGHHDRIHTWFWVKP